MKINHTYKINYKPHNARPYEEYEPGIGTIDYEDRIEPYLHTLWEKLNTNRYSRQAVLSLNRLDFPSCLLSYQVQLDGTVLYVTVNFRSQAKEYRIRDSRMIRYWTGKVIRKLDHLITEVVILCNVGNYHSIKERK